ncbi:hypothetical protein K491DRAFT_688734 [Lophiostoma macrostomum CBS 122681]|uniref:Cell wall anchored protein n=1 Tax=Lophiostoma macrostomum CBS 122681 TaxID=1314788 RepID=A0A6A6TLR0_9PLEO|nr:hypothetical protein K491DRAFT_688734 [Lophiostoma macrostomum CBS 122681]
MSTSDVALRLLLGFVLSFGGVLVVGDSFDLNPTDNFCSRWYTQSVVKNQVLYIDGGLQKWNGTDIKPADDQGVFGINNYLITIPLDKTFSWKTNITINSTPKNESSPISGSRPPSLMRGHMFHGPANDTAVYSYSGTVFMGNLSFPSYVDPQSSEYALWSYNPNATGFPWEQNDIGQPWRPNHGLVTEAIDQGLGFYLNGQIDEGTSQETLRNAGLDQYHALDGMLVINLHNYTSNNISTSQVRGNAPRIGGTMEYLAAVGGKGILVALGGQINEEQPWANVSGGQLIDFSAVDIFDIDSYLQTPSSNGTWYQQNTTGDIPKPRIDFCTVSVSAPDNSSHHIWMYGGNDPISSTMFDDVYVLSLPSFTWTAVYTNGGSPRWGHNCHLANGRQMVTVGGNITDHVCDWELRGIAFLDLNTIIWGSTFRANNTVFEVPNKLFAATGGSALGNATIKEPSSGWTDPRLKVVFDTARKWDLDANGSKKNHTGAIAGGVVGGVLGLALIAGGLFLWKRRRDKARQPVELEGGDNEAKDRPGELHDEIAKAELAVNEENPAELPVPDPVELPPPDPSELHAPREAHEADQNMATTTDAVELPSTNVAAGARPGVPHLRTPGDDLPELPAYTPGLTRPDSGPRRGSV